LNITRGGSTEASIRVGPRPRGRGNSDLQRLYAADARRSRLRLRRVSGHALVTILGGCTSWPANWGWRTGPTPFWGDAEIKLLTSWLHWYERHKAGRPGRGPLRQASEGLQEDIENLGIHRTVGACGYKLLCWRQKVLLGN